MATGTKVTKATAEKVRAAVIEQNKLWVDAGYGRPLLFEQDDRWEIAWEEGPFEWAFLFPGGGIEEEFGFEIPEVDLPAGVFVEPATSYSVQVVPL